MRRMTIMISTAAANAECRSPSKRVWFAANCKDQNDPEDNHPSGLSQPTDVDKLVYHRERRRRSMERYRERQRKRTTDLEAGDQQLKSVIELLQRRRDNLSNDISTRETIWAVAAQ
ncbi:unnamed protein product [Phytophthora fragariaefolia]|uniref:Unnamed protein product n=1 Tax=Phytophthora fragariaefolia TaxID=1490495 RepID=A0A9W6Y0V9_9STRA|nr:unnamed protein product [Phytophthora fragariaefolia]